MSKELSRDAEQGDTMIVVAVASVIFVFIECDNVWASDILQYCTSPLALNEDVVQISKT